MKTNHVYCSRVTYSRLLTPVAVAGLLLIAVGTVYGQAGDAAKADVVHVTPASVAKPDKADKHEHDHGDDHDHDHDHGHDHGIEVKLGADAILRYGVVVEKASPRPLTSSASYSASVKFDTNRYAQVGSLLTGRVVSLEAGEGDVVNAGDVLAIVQSPELAEAGLEFLVKKVAAQAARPQAELARAVWERAVGLQRESQSVTLSEVQRRELEYQAANGQLMLADAELSASREKLRLLGLTELQVEALAKTGKAPDRFEIRAPIAGAVLARSISLGGLVRPDIDALFTIADTGTVWVEARVPESELGTIRVGDQAKVSSPGGVKDLAAKVGFIAPLVQASNRTGTVRLIVINPADGPQLRPGMFASVEIFTAPASGRPGPGQRQAGTDAAAIPESAVQTIEGKTVVFVPSDCEPNTFTGRAVRIGEQRPGWVWVQDGLKVGEPYVAKGAFILKAEAGKAAAEHVH